MNYGLGIDLGTTFTAAAVYRDGSVRPVTLGHRSGAVPSAVFARNDGSFAYGEEAATLLLGEPRQGIREPKRRIGLRDPIDLGIRDAPADELLAGYLAWVVTRVAAAEGAPPGRVVLTYPAVWGAAKLEVFQAVAAQAGLAGASFMTEPHAAAVSLHADEAIPTGALVGVYDLGGGTFDAAVLRRTAAGFELVGTPEGVEHLGGVDFDETLFHHVRLSLGSRWDAAERDPNFPVAVAALRREVVAAKELLSEEADVDIPVMLPGAATSIRVSRPEFEMLIRPTVDETVGVLRRALRSAQVDPGQLTAVLLAGGSARIPLVGEAVRAALGRATVPADPKYAVARGAALLASEGAVETAPFRAPEPPPVPPPPVLPPAPPSAAAAGSGAPASAADAAAVGAGAIAVGAAAADRRVASRPAGGSPPMRPVGEDGPKRRGVLALVGIGAVAALVAGGVAFALSRGGDDDGGQVATATTEEGSGTTSTGGGDGPGTTGGSSGPSPAEVRLPSPEGMTEVVAAAYPLGSTTPGPEAAPVRTVELPVFHLDTFEVTNAQYRAFVEDQGAPPASTWRQGRMPEDKADHPVAGVEFAWAEAYCISLSKRLPTEAEWEAAARGPEGLRFPWGNNPAAVNLDIAGSTPVGSVAGNVSPAGVHDLVGSAWEWVGEPYEPVDPTKVVRRGGENGRLGDATFRQVVDPTSPSTVAETGFRCAADEVDPATPPLVFLDEHPVPDSVQVTTTLPKAGGPLVDEGFDRPDTGWPEKTDDLQRIGYHSPTYYHVEPRQPGTSVLALAGVDYGNIAVEADAFIDNANTTGTDYRWGLVVRAEGPRRPPPRGQGPLRPTNYYAFTISPSGKWELFHEDSRPQLKLAEGSLDGLGVSFNNPAKPDKLRAELRGNQLVFAINGRQVTSYDTRGFHLSGDVGFYVENGQQDKTHLHVDRLVVTAL
jgi:formylglycine-generating enzyme required for sulfatase activity/actin-like ATPase involved in cell morphogenesis